LKCYQIDKQSSTGEIGVKILANVLTVKTVLIRPNNLRPDESRHGLQSIVHTAKTPVTW